MKKDKYHYENNDLYVDHDGFIRIWSDRRSNHDQRSQRNDQNHQNKQKKNQNYDSKMSWSDHVGIRQNQNPTNHSNRNKNRNLVGNKRPTRPPRFHRYENTNPLLSFEQWKKDQYVQKVQNPLKITTKPVQFDHGSENHNQMRNFTSPPQQISHHQEPRTQQPPGPQQAYQMQQLKQLNPQYLYYAEPQQQRNFTNIQHHH